MCVPFRTRDNLTAPSLHKLYLSATASVLLAATVLLFGPLAIYYGSISQFSVTSPAVAERMVTVSTLFAAATCILLLLVPGRRFAGAVAIVFGFGVAAWMQGNLLVWDYGPLDGALSFDENRMFRVLDIVPWILVPAAAFRTRAALLPLIPAIGGMLLAIQTVSCLFTASETSALPSVKETNVVAPELFAFSTTSNVLIIALDSFQSDSFQALLNREPELASRLDGFTYYRNAVGAFATTRPAVLAALTGMYYGGENPFWYMMGYYYRRNSLPMRLKKAGFRVDLLTNTEGDAPFHCEAQFSDACVRGTALAMDYRAGDRQLALLTDISLFRHVPHLVKPYVYRDQAWLVSSRYDDANLPQGFYGVDVQMMRELAARANAGSQRPTFKYIHTTTPHRPIRMNERAEPVSGEFTRETCVRQSRGALKLAMEVLESLEREDAYDNTLIVILGDHGQRGDVPVDTSLVPYETSGKYLDDAELQSAKSKGVPLLLLKLPGATGSLVTSDAPVTTADIPRTVVEALGIPNTFPGVSMRDASPETRRDRRFYYYSGFDWANPFPPMTEYRVQGFSWLDESWQMMGTIQQPSKKKRTGTDIASLKRPVEPE